MCVFTYMHIYVCAVCVHVCVCTFLGEEMAAHSSILAGKIPWTKGSGRLQSMGLQSVGHELLATHMHAHTCIIAIVKYFSSIKKDGNPATSDKVGEAETLC